MSVAVKAENLTKKFGDFTAVASISFEIDEGTIVGFIGANGAGKSTTIKMLCGLMKPTSGEAFVAGFDVVREPEQVRQNIGYMSQKFSLYGDLTVRENIEFYGGIYGLSNSQLRERYEWVLDAADLRGKEAFLTRDLPIGWRQRLALGCAVLHKPKIIFLDEPTSGVDPILRIQFWQLIANLVHEGSTAIVTTHYLDEAEFCENIMLMHLGKILIQGAPAKIRAQFENLPLFEIRCQNAVEILQALEHEPWVNELSVLGGSVHLYTEDGITTMDLENFLRDKDLSFLSIERTLPTLEDIFVKVTQNG
ncbi:MAG: ATP-binding cassette domain-containing protein [Bacteroidota bacterium]